MNRYRNPWHNPINPIYGPEFYETNAKGIEHAGCMIYERIDGRVWDVTKDGTCITQRAGLRGAKEAADALA